MFEIEPAHPPTYAAAALLLAIVALAACWLPARRATHADPAAVLRYDQRQALATGSGTYSPAGALAGNA